MPTIEIGPDLIQIDAEVVANALKIAPQDLKAGMREGTVTSRFERGEEEDAGRIRLTFFSATRRARITADTAGRVLSCSTADFSRPFISASQVPEPGGAPAAPDRNMLDAMLDAALSQTFPASDPVALDFERRG